MNASSSSLKRLKRSQPAPIFFSFAIAFLFLSVPAAANEPDSGTFRCSQVRGLAGLRIEGSLSEWDPRIAAQPLRWSRNGPADSTTATVGCLADDQFLYLGVAVNANSLRFENMPFNQAWRNDAVEVFISGQPTGPSSHIRTGLIRVSSDSSGRTITEGAASVTDGVHTTGRFSYPLLWDALEVKTGLQVAPAGYSVEVAVPRDSMGWKDSVVSELASVG